jgi:peptide/nickel transport system substrate-binding protein
LHVCNGFIAVPTVPGASFMHPRLWLLFAAVALALSAAFAHAESVVRYGMSMADIPLTTGQPDRGAGAYQFTGRI